MWRERLQPPGACPAGVKTPPHSGGGGDQGPRILSGGAPKGSLDSTSGGLASETGSWGGGMRSLKAAPPGKQVHSLQAGGTGGWEPCVLGCALETGVMF